MLKYKTHILFLIIIGLGLFYVINKYNETTPNTSFLKTEIELDTNAFIELVNTNNNVLSSELIEKTIQIEGVIKNITHRNNVRSIFLFTDNDSSSVVCQMQSNQKEIMSSMKAGDTIIVKGIYKGALLDPILLHCVIMNK